MVVAELVVVVTTLVVVVVIKMGTTTAKTPLPIATTMKVVVKGEQELVLAIKI